MKRPVVKKVRLGSSGLSARLLWECRRVWEKAGWQVVLGSMAIALSVAAAWDTRHLVHQENLVLKKLYAAKSNESLKQPVVHAKGEDITQQLSDFYAYLPSHDSIPDQLKQLIILAQKNEVVLVQAEYKVQAEANADFLRYQITFPVKANYPNIQAFIIQALKDLPALTLEAVSFKRERIEFVDVDAKIQYVLFVRKQKEQQKEQKERT